MSGTQRSPLDGLRVVITRAEAQSGKLRSELESRGVIVLTLPSIAIEPASPGTIDAVLDRLATYDWIVFTSGNAVRVLLDQATHEHLQRMSSVRVAAVGRSTARQLSDRNVRVDLIPDRFEAKHLVRELVERNVAGQHVLVPCSALARDTVAEGLRVVGAVVDVVAVYRTVQPDTSDSQVVRSIMSGQVEVITFASPSAVRNTLEMSDGALPNDIVIACIGPVTAEQARRLGLRVDVQATEPSVQGLVAAISDFWEQRGKRELING